MAQRVARRRKRKALECPCLQVEFAKGRFWGDPKMGRRGSQIQALGNARVFSLEIKIRTVVALTCANQPNRNCSAKVECTARPRFQNLGGTQALNPIIVPSSQTITGDCDGAAKNIVTGFTIMFLFVGPPQPRNRLRVTGDIDIRLKLSDCNQIGAPNPWKMLLKLKLEGPANNRRPGVDKENSDYDGDGKKNSAEPGANASERKRNMYDPSVP